MRRTVSVALGASLASGLALTTLALTIIVACSDDDRRDQYYGTDAAAGYRGPEASVPATGADGGNRAESGDAATMDAGAGI